MDTTKKKLRIIQIVEELQNDRYLSWLLKVLEVLKIMPSDASFIPPPIVPNEQSEIEETRISKLIEIAKQPMPDTIDLEQLKKEQGYDSQKLKEVWENFDHNLFNDEPPLEELIKMIK